MPRLYSALVVVPCLLAGLGLAGCAAPTPPARRPPQTFAPALSASAEAANPNESTLTNDPSAPVDTPLCGTAAREGMAMAVQNYPQPLAVGSSCTQNACFNTQTGTYIAADGTRRVCR